MTDDTTDNNVTDNNDTDAPGVEPRTEDAPPEVFDRSYVEKLRKEAAEYRVRAKDRDQLAHELFHSRVAAFDRLADPTDLPYADNLLNDRAALERAIDELLARKPHLAARHFTGSIGQGEASTPGVNLADILREAL